MVSHGLCESLPALMPCLPRRQAMGRVDIVMLRLIFVHKKLRPFTLHAERLHHAYRPFLPQGREGLLQVFQRRHTWSRFRFMENRRTENLFGSLARSKAIFF